MFALQDGLPAGDGEGGAVVDIDQARSDGLWSPVSASLTHSLTSAVPRVLYLCNIWLKMIKRAGWILTGPASPAISFP